MGWFQNSTVFVKHTERTMRSLGRGHRASRGFWSSPSGGLLFFGVLCLCSESVACWLEIKHSSSGSKEVPASRCLDRRKRNARAVGKSLEALVPICGLTTALQIPWVDSVSFLFIPLSLAKANQVRGQYAATQTSRNACSAPPGEES